MAVFGAQVASIDEDEFNFLFESGKFVRDLKGLQVAQIEHSRFRQKLFRE